MWARAAAQSQATADPRPVTSVQLPSTSVTRRPRGEVGCPSWTRWRRCAPSWTSLGLDASRHVVDTYAEFLDALGVTRSRDLLRRRSKAELLVAGVKVATQTPPIRSGRRVVFLTLDDATGPVDATFFEDAQGPRRHRLRLLAAGGTRRAAAHRPAGGLAARHRRLGAAGAGRAGERGRRGGARADGRGAGGFLRGGVAGSRRRDRRSRREPLHPTGHGGTGPLCARVCRAAAHQGRCRRHGAATGAGALRGSAMSPYSDIKPAGESKGRRPGGPRTSPAGCGIAAPGARDDRAGARRPAGPHRPRP
ncbi:MAG: hypothetical protein R2731_02670 [Nocardioides sp.]